MESDNDDDKEFLLHHAVDVGASSEIIPLLLKAWPGAIMHNFWQRKGILQRSVSLIQFASARKMDYCISDFIDAAMECLRLSRDGWEEAFKFFEAHVHIDEAVERLLVEFPDFPKLRKEARGDSSSYTCPLFYAVPSQRASRNVIRRLVAGHPKSLVLQNDNGSTPLMLYIQCCDDGYYRVPDDETIRLLVSPEAARIRNNEGKFPLHRICQWAEPANLDTVRTLVEAYPESLLEKYGDDGDLPLHILCSHKWDASAIQYVANSCPQSVFVRNTKGELPLHIACSRCINDDLPLIRLLIETYPESVEILDNRGFLPLHHVIYDEDYESYRGDYRYEIVCFLVDRFPDAIKIRRSNAEKGHETSFHLACLFEAGVATLRLFAERAPELLEPTEGTRGDTPFHTLCGEYANIDLESLQVLAISENACKARDSAGRTPFHLLIDGEAESSPDVIKFFVEQWPSLLRECDDEGRNSLHVLVSCARVEQEILDYLLDVDPSLALVKDNNGKTPFLLACENDLDLTTVYKFVRRNPLQMLGLERGQSRVPPSTRGAKRKRES